VSRPTRESTPRQTRSLCFFNNKGGVEKTTLACNETSFLAHLKELRVLVNDADPQCNARAYRAAFAVEKFNFTLRITARCAGANIL
jgi:cellulose biosynthesis protein BcsQ